MVTKVTEMELLPKELNYLEAAACEMARLPADELNEDVDTTSLDAALRDRVKGLKLRDGVSRLTEDHKLLRDWLKENDITDGAAFWISAYLMRPGPLARSLLAPPPPPGPMVWIDPPKGWLSKSATRSLCINLGKLFCFIIIWDAPEFGHSQHENQHREELQKSPQNPWANLGVWSSMPVKFGECHGCKYRYAQSGKLSWKQIEYLLEVPGGFVSVRVGHEQGKDFDEAVVEQTLHTLKVSYPPHSVSSVIAS